ncbi:MAG: LPS export ABC transporter periplasmic protein LptC [Candidatus Saccharibacteria bacterium]|nr:LPS export ABC transporter periplasmic protein LptC [Moraxellaceae bacterium]
MSTRLLYLLAFGFISLAAIFYMFNREKTQPPIASHSEVDYSATNIVGLQTDDDGLIQNQIQADTLRHYPQGDRMELDRIASVWYKVGKPQTKLNADKGVSLQNNDKVILTGKVHVQQLATPSHAETNLYTTELNGYPKTKKVDTDMQVTVQSAKSKLVSQGVRADLNNGQYEFFKPRGIYVTAPRP